MKKAKLLVGRDEELQGLDIAIEIERISQSVRRGLCC
jgi:hypothetical protein